MIRTDDEINLIERSRSGDHSAFALLVNHNQIMIRAVAFRMTGSVETADELAQEAFLRAWQHLDSFSGDSKFSTWLCRIAINLSLDWRKREGRRTEVHAKWAEGAIQDRDDARGFRDELSRRVQVALNRLPAKQRAAIVLTIYDNQTHAEAAKTLGCTEATVSWRVFVARQKLKRLLKEISDEKY